MSEQRDDGAAARTQPGEPDVLTELEAELARELAEERPPAGGPAYQVVGALVALTLGLGGAVLAYGYGLGSLRRPGPGLWPFIISLALIGLSVALLIGGRHLTDSEAFGRSSLQPAIGLLTFVAFGALMPVVGFEIPSVLMCAIWLRFLGGESWRSTAVISLCTTAAFYVLFLYVLGIPLPHLI